MNYQIVNARIVNEGTITEGNVVIEGERIKGINAPAPEHCETIDAEGCLFTAGHDRRPSAFSRTRPRT